MTIKNHPPASLPIGPDSELLITQLVAAGAVIFGYTNVPVNASDWQTYNPVYGTTNNPWSLDRTPGRMCGVLQESTCLIGYHNMWNFVLNGALNIHVSLLI